MDKCLGILEMNNDPMKRIESKIQRCVRKIKSKFTKYENSKLYLTGYAPGKFYGL